MRTKLFFPVLIIACICSLCFRLQAVLTDTAEPIPNTQTPMQVLTQKVAAQQPTEAPAQPVVFNLSEMEQNALADVENIENAQYLANLYGQMRPKAAARILQQLTNEKIVRILSYMTTAQSAAILADMPAPRAGTISLQLADKPAE